MKKVNIISFLLIFMSFIIRKNSTDFRDSYTGEYTCIKRCAAFSSSASSTQDTIILQVSKDEVDSVLNVTFQQQSHKIKISSRGFVAYPHGNWHVNFRTDTILFMRNYGRGSSCMITGTKN